MAIQAAAPVVRVRTLGEFSVFHDGRAVALPASRRARALLAYLLLAPRPHRRDRLCELFWEVPDDPRGALRWALSKLRPVVNAGSVRLIADRERVELRGTDLQVDVREVATALEVPDLTPDQLRHFDEALARPLLEGIDLPDQPLFRDWLNSEREEARRLRGRTLQRLAAHPQFAPDRALAVARRWMELEPFSTAAGTQLLTRLEQTGRVAEAHATRAELTARFRRAGIAWAGGAQAAPPRAGGDAGEASTRQYLARQKIQFCTAADNVRLAWATVGSGPPIIKAANWLSHLELDWEAPMWSPLFRQLAQQFQFIRYDERGNGLSDWEVEDLGFGSFVTDLETVVEASGLQRFALLGISQGAAVSIEYAVRHPGRVSRLILFGGYPAGWRIDASPQTIREREAVMTLTAAGWGQDNPAYRQIFSSTFMPSATAEELHWFNEFQRRTTSPGNAVRFLSAFGDIDVRDRLAKVQAPTLVIHSLRDRRIPAATGREIAARIPSARFLGLDSDGHLLLGREPASRVFVDAVKDFLGEDS